MAQENHVCQAEQFPFAMYFKLGSLKRAAAAGNSQHLYLCLDFNLQHLLQMFLYEMKIYFTLAWL